jgi:hypothetical protein
MEYRFLLDHWSELVRAFKDSEKENGVEPRDSELLALAALDHIQWTRIRQWNLFVQKRGEDFEKFVEALKRRFEEPAIRRFLEDEELWKVTLEMGEY